ncbi:MAG TPA: hypothetical protein VKV80_13125 [Streptosporangiaceae bacterium]|nr:hypothetical protein [Streptosporangiaceae bacterium]
MRDLAALTPPLVVCAAFLIGAAALLRREMAPGRRTREDSEDSVRRDSGTEDGNSAENGITETKIPGSAPADDLSGSAPADDLDADRPG